MSEVLVVRCVKEELEAAASIVKRGGTVVYPTDTVYGLGCNPFDEYAVDRVLQLKERAGKPLPVLCSNRKYADELVELGPIGTLLAHQFWPGALTMVARVRELASVHLPSAVTQGLPKLGIRIPNHKGALRLIQLCGGRLVGTSANRSGLKAPRSSKEVCEVLGSDFDVLVDGGVTPHGIESTVIDVSQKGLRLLREGSLALREIKKSLRGLDY